MNRRLALRVLATLLASAAASVVLAGPRVLAVRAWPGRSSTRITIESDSELRFFVSTLANPDRTIVDLSDVQADAAFHKALETLRNDTGVLTKARIGQFRPDTARLVLDMKSRAEVVAFALPPAGSYKHRLVIDLTPFDAEDPIAAFLSKLIEREAQLERAAEAQAQAQLQGQKDQKGGAALPPPNPATPTNPLPPQPPRKPALPAVGADSARSASGDPAGGPRHIKPFVVVLDPGHGGEDSGAIGPGGTYEKNVVLAIALKTKMLLELDPRVVVFMTREEDVFVPLYDRVAKARSVNADVFVSIHADAFTRPDVRGSSVFALSERGASSAAAKWIADKENQSDLIGGVRLQGRDPQLAKMLLEMSQSMTNADSFKLAQGMVSELKPIGPMHKGKVEQAGFAVLRSPDVPSILVETAFISNPDEEIKLASPTHQMKLAKALRAGVRKFLATQRVRT